MILLLFQGVLQLPVDGIQVFFQLTEAMSVGAGGMGKAMDDPLFGDCTGQNQLFIHALAQGNEHRIRICVQNLFSCLSQISVSMGDLLILGA